MATLSQDITVRSAMNTRTVFWLVAFGVLAVLLSLVTKAIMDNPSPPQDIRIMEWVAGWDFRGLTTFFNIVSFVTGPRPGIVYGLMGVTFLLLLGKTRSAVVFTGVGVTIGLIAVLGDLTLGEILDRGRPLALSDNPNPAFPSGHVFGSTVFFGFMGFLAVYYKLKPKIFFPLLAVFGITIILAGPARVHLQAHFPSDVAAGYLLGALWLMVIIPVFLFVRRTQWMSAQQNKENLAVAACGSCKVASSIASVVVLDPVQGTATKVYTPPPLVRLIYWMAFQAKFPYETNSAALQAGKYRRQIASLLTIHRFGKDLVAPVTTIDCGHGNCRFVTEFIPGEVAENDGPAQKFMGEVSEIFAQAGLSVWQVNPRNPHAHTNLIKSADGDYTIIDLESAEISLLPAPGQFRSSLKSGNLPIFDDIDFPRLRDFIVTNEAALTSSIGADGVKALIHATDHAEEAINTWKAAEPRVIGHLIAGTYRLLNVKARFQHLMGSLAGADAAAELFLNSGIDRWEKEYRIAPEEADELRTRLASEPAREATKHLGVHLVMSVAIALPVPGMRSLARFLWTLVFWSKAQIARFGRKPEGGAGRLPNVHTPLVMVLALIPLIGGVAYLASAPMRSKIMVRLMLDQAAWRLPFHLYRRTHIGRWLAPPVRNSAQPPFIKRGIKNNVPLS